MWYCIVRWLKILRQLLSVVTSPNHSGKLLGERKTVNIQCESPEGKSNEGGRKERMFDLGFESGYLNRHAAAAQMPLSVSCHSCFTLPFSSSLKWTVLSRAAIAFYPGTCYYNGIDIHLKIACGQIFKVSVTIWVLDFFPETWYSPVWAVLHLAYMLRGTLM